MDKILKIFLILILTNCLFAQEQTVGLFTNSQDAFNGYTLFSPMSSQTTYLVNNCGEVINTWEANNTPGLMAYLDGQGRLYRTGRTTTGFGTGGVGGLIEIRDWDNRLEWSYEYAGDSIKQHHDIEVLPNGNFLLIAWEKVSADEAIENGRNPSSMSNSEIWMEQIVELKPIGSDQVEIVWEWHVKDHLVQSYDDTKLNFGSVRDSVHLIDLNYKAFSTISPGQPGNRDWLHYNAVSYLPEEDLILFSSRNFHEIYIIDHSTTTEESASHSGGRYNKGGDILFRWGNPAAYKNGGDADQLLFSQHNCDWVRKDGIPTGEITIFNNGLNRSPFASSIEIIVPQRDANGFFGRTSYGDFALERHQTIFSTDSIDFDSPRLSSVQVLDNNNTLICAGNQGKIIEITPEGKLVWSYVNPVGNFSITPQFENPVGNEIFRAIRYAPDFEGFQGLDLTPGVPIESDALEDNCEIFDLSNNENKTIDQITVYPNPFISRLTIDSENNREKHFSVYNPNGHQVLKGLFFNKLDISTENLSSGIYYLKVTEDASSHIFKLIRI